MTTTSLSVPRPRSPEAAPNLASAAAGSLRRLLRGLRPKAGPAAAKGQEADAALRRLLDESPARRFARVVEEPESVGRRLCTRLLAEARALLDSDSVEAERLAQLALFLAERLDAVVLPAVVIFDYQAEAWMLIGQARTTYGSLKQASMAFQVAACLLSSGSGDIELQGAFLKAKARLYRARGESELARRADHRARIILGSLYADRVCT